jgi:hypothetical protein
MDLKSVGMAANRPLVSFLSRYLASSATMMVIGPMESTSGMLREKVSKKVTGRKDKPKSS